jgi:hypothetical protein
MLIEETEELTALDCSYVSFEDFYDILLRIVYLALGVNTGHERRKGDDGVLHVGCN